MKCRLLCGMLGFVAVLATGAWADEVKVTMDFTVTGASICGSGGTSPCVDTLVGSFLWNNTTGKMVPGSASVMITGPLDYGMLAVTGPVSVGSVSAIEETFTDPGGDYASFATFFSSNLTPGTYSYDTMPGVAGTVTGVGGKCVSTTDNCLTYFPKGSTFGGMVVVTEVTTTTTPEPGTLGLLGTGVVGIAGLFRRKFLS